MSAYTKLVCRECSWRGTSEEVLTAPNPFAPDTSILGCPNCSAVESMRTCCDEPGCYEQDTIGTPKVFGSPDGYRRTCYKHMPLPL